MQDTTDCGGSCRRWQVAFNFSKEDLQAVGSCIELPAGGGPQGKDRRERAALPMGLHYSGQKTHRSAVVKLKLWKRFMFLARRKLSGLALTHGGLVDPKVLDVAGVLPRPPQCSCRW